MDIHFSDGTPVQEPPNPLEYKWKINYPSCNLEDIWTCLQCSRCPLGGDWKCPEEDKEVYNKHIEQVKQYYENHGGFLNVIIPINLNIKRKEK